MAVPVAAPTVAAAAAAAAPLPPYHYSSRIQFKATASVAAAPIYPPISAVEHHPIVMLQQQELQQPHLHQTLLFERQAPATMHEETIQPIQNSVASVDHGLRQHELLVQARYYKPIPSWVCRYQASHEPSFSMHRGATIDLIGCCTGAQTHHRRETGNLATPWVRCVLLFVLF